MYQPNTEGPTRIERATDPERANTRKKRRARADRGAGTWRRDLPPVRRVIRLG